MKGKMKAYVFEEKDKAVFKEIDIPAISDQEILVKVKANGICHSDYELLEGRYIIPFSYPIIPGHEWSGEIVETGKDVSTFKKGDRVVGECVIGCGVCKVCQEGNFTYCPTSDHFGFTIDGAVAEYLVAKPEWLHKFPDNVDWKTASMIEPFSVAYNGINGIGGCDASETVVVIGGGTIGLCAAACAKAMGARVITIEPHAYRRDIAKKLNVDYVIDPMKEDAEAVIKKLTGGFGADLVVEASGSSPGLKSSLDLVKNGGRVSYIGINIGNEIPVELGKIQIRGITAKGFIGSPYVWDKVVAFLSQSQLDLSPISTHQFPLMEAEKAYNFARDIITNELVKVTLMNE